MTIRNGEPCAVCGFSITNWRHQENDRGEYDYDDLSHPYVKGGVVSEPRTKATHPNDAPNRATTLPKDAKARKRFPLATGLFDYFPDALCAVAEVSFIGNEQHNPGEPLHWARGKSTDQDDTTLRHFIERGLRDSDGVRHSAKAAWRILAMLQLEIEAEQEAAAVPMNPNQLDRPALVEQNFGLKCRRCGERLGEHLGYDCTDGRGSWQ